MSTTSEPADETYMRAALGLARRGLGTVWPNPAVGCVVVRDGTVVGRGWTQPGGRPHAETEALVRAGAAAAGACAYVSLEPCNHFGKTPPCAKALVDAGVSRVVSALEDPDPRTAGSGHETLRAGGVEIITGVLSDEAASVNAGFLMRLREGRPLVTLKTATTLDGKIAAGGGKSKWITGPQARVRGHLLRAGHDAILVGIGTALADTPLLTCRIPGLESRSPVRVVLDSKLRLPVDAPLVATARETPTWIVTTTAEPAGREHIARGVEILRVEPGSDGHVDIRTAVQALSARGITRLLVEGGGAVAASLFRRALVDRIAWFRSPRVMGDDGIAAVAPYGMTHPGELTRFERVESLRLGEDTVDFLERRTILD